MTLAKLHIYLNTQFCPKKVGRTNGPPYLPSSFFVQSTAINNFDEPLLLQKSMQYFEQRSPAPINTHEDYHIETVESVDRKLFEAPSLYNRVDRVKKDLESSYTGPY